MKETFRNLLAQGNTKEVIIELLSVTANDRDLHNRVVHLSARFSQYENQKLGNLEDPLALNIELNKINNILLIIIDELPNGKDKILPSLSQSSVELSSKKWTGLKDVISLIKKNWSKTVTKIIAVTGFIVAVAVVLSNLRSIKEDTNSLLDDNIGLKIVDVSFLTQDTIEVITEDVASYLTDGYDTLDIKLRNNGKEVAFAKRIDIKIKQYWELQYDEQTDYMQQPPSATYLMRLPIEPNKIPYILNKNISQIIKPGETDRIYLALRSEHKSDNAFVYNVDLSIIADEDNKTVTQKNILLGFQLPYQNYYTLTDYNEGDDRVKKIYKRNQENVKQIEAIDGIKSKTVLALVEKVKGTIDKK